MAEAIASVMWDPPILSGRGPWAPASACLPVTPLACLRHDGRRAAPAQAGAGLA
jgi:hypothetical protein